MVFRNTSYACPGCSEALAADAPIAWCQACKGVWVSEAELEERVRVVRGKHEFNLELVLEPARSASRAQARRPCPLCREPLGHVRMGQAEVDRCGQKHGIWFDAQELEAVLNAATEGVGVKVPRVRVTPEEDVTGGLLATPGPSNEPMSLFDVHDSTDLIEYIVVSILRRVFPR